jgi:hypothetical protein
MITQHRTATLTAGNLARAMTWAHEIAACIKQSVGTSVAVEMPVGGDTWQIRWTLQYDSLAAYEASANALRADPKYMALLASGSDLFLPGATTDQFWRTV